MTEYGVFYGVTNAQWLTKYETVPLISTDNTIGVKVDTIILYIKENYTLGSSYSQVDPPPSCCDDVTLRRI